MGPGIVLKHIEDSVRHHMYAGKGHRDTFFGIDFTKRRTDLTGLQIVPPHKSHGLRIEKKLPGALSRTH